MAAFLHDDVYDDGLNVLTSASSKVLHICSAQPANFAEVAGVSLGNKPAQAIGSPEVGTTGRKVVVGAVATGGSVTATGTASHYAIVDGTRLLAANSLAASQAVTSGNTFTLAAFDIAIPAPV